jgi:acyl-CoA dehydrogenase
MIFPLGQWRKPPSDETGHQVASLLLTPGPVRDRLTEGVYIPRDEDEAVGALEAALASTLECEPLQAELERARKEGKLKAHSELEMIAEAREQGLIDEAQAARLERDYALRRKVIMVDDFAAEQLRAQG